MPLIESPLLWHVGTLDAADKSSHFSSSYEGNCLSVSPCPGEWERIAKLGGYQWWQLERPGALFLDAHGLDETQRTQVRDWALSEGLALERDSWCAELFWNDEVGYTESSAHPSRREALEDAYDHHETLRELIDSVSRRTLLQPTEKLKTRLGMKLAEDGFDYILLCYVEDCLPELDGVYWDDRYGPWSAPRAGILPGKLAAWTATAIARDTSIGGRFDF
jgi:hypothetical protein